ncbi:diguanylate cyclase (GGDEF) domain-containing protein [Granulicella rosea]|uniref:diguanylate cyclase n=1 Tax=Granulicella rosea TaxID=474952 RepID=A0A239LAM9_9BACT|nr:GGDEF domain-containing protein [Granulicella rosea]SNT26903.1 diguanylate cyclase (GGDEF) domain-containing protein [Granulicella rosea]
MTTSFHFDIGTQCAAACLLCLVFGVVLLLLARRFPHIRGAHAMAQGFFCSSFAAGIFLLRGPVLDTPSFVVANGLLWTGFILFYRGVAESLRMRPSYGFPVAVAAVGLASLAIHGQVDTQIITRIGIISATSFLLKLYLAIGVARHRPWSRLQRWTLGFVAASMLVNLLRSLGTLVVAPSASIFQYDPVQAGYTLSALLSALGLGILCLALVGQQVTAGIEQDARRDTLTGALNRLGIEELMAVELERARRGATSFAIALLDVDNFKAFNDLGGHAAGDEVLRHVVASISRQLRPYDACGRLGGDEFLILLPGASEFDAQAVCDRILREVSMRPAEGVAEPIPTVSMGWTIASRSDLVAEILARADRALYSAKQQGRNCVQTEMKPRRTHSSHEFPVLHAAETSVLRRVTAMKRRFRA